MKAALAVNLVTGDLADNLEGIVKLVEEAAMAGADLVLFPETALTGLINNDVPAHDLPLGQEIPGSATNRLALAARKSAIYVGIGLFEREGSRLYDTAILIDPAGDIALKYRRISKGWHAREADTHVYREGSYLPVVSTPFGSVAFLICGDLFDDTLVAEARALKPDLLLFPLARNFDDSSYDQRRWDEEEAPEYAKRAAMVNATTLMVNYLGDASWDSYGMFGGAMAVSSQGEILASWPLGRPGLLLVDLPEKGKQT